MSASHMWLVASVLHTADLDQQHLGLNVEKIFKRLIYNILK